MVGQEGEAFISYLIKAVPWVYRAPQVDVWVFEESPSSLDYRKQTLSEGGVRMR